MSGKLEVRLDYLQGVIWQKVFIADIKQVGIVIVMRNSFANMTPSLITYLRQKKKSKIYPT